MVEIVKGDHEVELPDTLAALLIRHRGWEVGSGQEISEELAEKLAEPETNLEPAAPETEPEPEPELEPEPAPAPRQARAAAAAETVETVAAVDIIDPAAACDDDLPEGIVFADSAYTTVVDKETGEKIRVLKTHCRNGHEYSTENTKIRVRDDKAYRECQTCLAGRKQRAANKRAAAKKEEVTDG